MQVIKPDSSNQLIEADTTVFLAGSIEMGKATDWQNQIERALIDFDVTLFNPRRNNWNSKWEQTEKNDDFNYQVNWELNRLDSTDIVFMNFLPDTKSPISLLELGAYAKTKKMIVCCPPGFWRKGNVDIFCNRNGISVYSEFDDAIGALMTQLRLNR